MHGPEISVIKMRIPSIHWKVRMRQGAALAVEWVTVTMLTIFKTKGQEYLK